MAIMLLHHRHAVLITGYSCYAMIIHLQINVYGIIVINVDHPLGVHNITYT